MNTECPAIETQKADNMVHSGNIYLVLTIRQTVFYILGIYTYLNQRALPSRGLYDILGAAEG